MPRSKMKTRKKKSPKDMKRKTRQKYGLSQVQEQVAKFVDDILEGTVIAIDPSCISSSSVPGWAIYEEGELVDSGTITGISPYSDLNRRLMFIGRYIREHFNEPNVLVIEKIQAHRHGRTNESLLKAVGAIVANFDCEIVIEVMPLVWQKYLAQTHGNDYETAKHYRETMKGDEEDAIHIGQAIISMAEELRTV